MSILVACIFVGEILYLNLMVDSVIPRSYFYAGGLFLICILHFIDGSLWSHGIFFLKTKSTISLLFLLMVVSTLVYVVRFNVDLTHEYLPWFLAAVLVPLFFGCMGVVFSRFGESAYWTSFASLIASLTISIIILLIGFSVGLEQSSILYRGDADFLIDMHYFADYFSILALVFLSKNYKLSWYFSAFALVFAFVLGSRTAFVFLGVSVVLFAIINEELKLIRFFIAAVVCSTFFYILYAYYPSGYESLTGRMFDIGKYSNSFDDREGIVTASVAAYDLSCLPAGCFAFELTHMGESGSYVHNWISFFISFGLPAFVIYLYYLFNLIKLILSGAMFFKKYFHLVFFLVLCTGFSRSYIWPYWLFIMMFIAYDASGLLSKRSRMGFDRPINSGHN